MFRTKDGGISTHAPLAGRDPARQNSPCPTPNFNPRAPCGARRTTPNITRATSYFNPRAPCGARLATKSTMATNPLHFNPRAPCGARPTTMSAYGIIVAISTHAPLAGRDRPPRRLCAGGSYFNPRAPCGARHSTEVFDHQTKRFQPTRPLRGATAKVYKSLCTFLR